MLKPFSFERFIKAINKTIGVSESKLNIYIYNSEIQGNSFFLKGNKKYHQVHLESILFIEAYGHYTKVYLDNEMILSHEKISSLEEFLPESSFIRTH